MIATTGSIKHTAPLAELSSSRPSASTALTATDTAATIDTADQLIRSQEGTKAPAAAPPPATAAPATVAKGATPPVEARASVPTCLAEIGSEPLTRPADAPYITPYIDNTEHYDTRIGLHYVEGGYTETHMAMVGRYIDKFASALDNTAHALTPEQKQNLSMAAEVFDAGKAVVPDSVWDNPGKPSPADWKQMCRHVEISTEQSRADGKPVDREVERKILGLSGSLSDKVRVIVRGHHEKLDGSGYPDKLKGDQIPKEARMLGIVDAWDALTNPRSFRPARDHETAAGILLGDAKAGKLDASLVDTFLARVVPDQKALDSHLGERTQITEKLKDDCYHTRLRQKQDVAIQCGWESADQWFGFPTRD